MIPGDIIGQLAIGFMFAVCGFALLRGGWPEWIVAILLVACQATLPLYHGRGPDHELRVPWGMAVQNVVFLAALVLVQLRAPRRWLLVAIGIQTLSVFNLLAMPFDPSIPRWARDVVDNVATILMEVCLLVGTIQTFRTQRAQGAV
jgi:hypothetical protein